MKWDGVKWDGAGLDTEAADLVLCAFTEKIEQLGDAFDERRGVPH